MTILTVSARRRGATAPGAGDVPATVADLAVWLDSATISGVGDGATLASWPGAVGTPDAAAGTNSPTYKTTDA